jgi:hypothetical protein
VKNRPCSDVLLDEQTAPSVRTVIGTLLSRAAEADFAIARIRLGAVDLTPDELAAVRRCRVLVGRLDVQSLAAARHESDAGLDALLAFLASGRIEVRSAGATGWATDFSIFRGLPGTDTGQSHDGGRPPGQLDPKNGATAPASVFHVPHGGTSDELHGACLIGAHAFWVPQSTEGPSFTAVLRNTGAVRMAGNRFEQLWARSYDVLPVLLHTMAAIGNAR